MYAGQYAGYAALAAPTASPAAVSQAAVMPPVTQSLSLDASQAQANAAAVAGNNNHIIDDREVIWNGH